MNFEIKKLSQEGIIPFEFVAKHTDFSEIEGVVDEEGVLVQGTIEKVSKGTFSVNLSVKTTMIYPCARCLEETSIDCHYDYSDMLTVEDGETMLKLLPLVEDCIYINEPFRILCHEACAGLCPKCGKNLNHEQCECDKFTDYDPRFEALKDLF